MKWAQKVSREKWTMNGRIVLDLQDEFKKYKTEALFINKEINNEWMKLYFIQNSLPWNSAHHFH